MMKKNTTVVAILLTLIQYDLMYLQRIHMYKSFIARVVSQKSAVEGEVHNERITEKYKSV